MIRNTRGEAKTHGLSHPMSGNFNSKRSPTLSPNTLLLPHSSRPTHGDRSIYSVYRLYLYSICEKHKQARNPTSPSNKRLLETCVGLHEYGHHFRHFNLQCRHKDFGLTAIDSKQLAVSICGDGSFVPTERAILTTSLQDSYNGRGIVCHQQTMVL